MVGATISQRIQSAESAGLPQIALTKTVPPSANRVHVERDRLLSLLDEAAARRLIVIKAPAGYGKTTLAVDWSERLRTSSSVVAWLSLDDDDNEPSAFAYHVAKAIHRGAPHLGQFAIDLLAETKLIDSKNVFSAAINAVAESDDEVYVFLDDYHLVTDRRPHELTSFLLRYSPSNFHLVVMSRTEPPLSISKLRLDDEVAELDVADLRFTLGEAQQFLGAEQSSKLEPEDISKLHDATEGWPAALQLARISVRNSPDPSKVVRSFSGASRKISSYIEDALATQADEIVQFLLQTAVLDRLHASLCQSVTGIARSADLLKALNHEQLLLMTLDEENGWYRYHHLMSDYLIDRLRTRMPDQIPELHRKAYTWYAAQQMWNLAVQHAIAAKDFDQAMAFVDECAMSLVVKGDLLTLLAWEHQLPAELMTRQSDVKLALAWGLELVSRFAEADTLLKQVEAAGADKSGIWWRCRVIRAGWLGLSDDTAEAYKVAEEAQQYPSHDAFELNALRNIKRYGCLKAGEWDEFYAIPKPEQGLEETNVLAENFRLCFYGMAAACRLEIDAALQFYRDARTLAEKYVGAKSVSVVMATSLIALLQYERGDASPAEIAVSDELIIIETAVFHEGFLSAFTVLVRAAICRGDTERALMLLNRAERLADERGWGRITAALLIERLRIFLYEQRVEEARAVVEQLKALRNRYPAPERCAWSEIHINASVGEGLLAVAEGSADRAVPLLTWAWDELSAIGNRLGRLRVGLELANARFLAGSGSKAFAGLNQILEWAAKAGAVSFAIERPREFDRLFTAAQNDPIEVTPEARAFLKKLTGGEQATPGTACAPAVLRGQKPVLTERERTIVEFIARGQSNKQIARTLGVTPETIKTHVKRIFIKLSAESRAQAVVRAQSLGLLHNASVT
jgi:LuxR family maltose regulon positive regulatory protein